MMTCLLVCLSILPGAISQPSDRIPPRPAGNVVWLEGESPSSANVEVQKVGWGQKELLSGEAWGTVNLDEAKTEKELPAEGAILTYKFTEATGGSREIWNRVGYEFVRSPFSWRVGNDTWRDVSPEELTTDLQTISEWTEVAWSKLGNAEVSPGENTLQIKISKTKNSKGETQRTLYASDALVVSDGPFVPHSRYKPGEEWQTERDRAAAAKVFSIPMHDSALRSSVLLAGDWEIARDDDQLPPPNIAVPMEIPRSLPFWSAIPVPSDRNVSRPDLVFAHRIWYRTRVDVPRGLTGRSCLLRFGANNLNSTIAVNGQLCGFEKNPWVPFQVDVSKAIKPGINEIMVGIRDPWYGYSTSPTRPMKLRKTFNLPLSFTGRGFQDLAYPVWNAFQSGILDTPVLECAGPTYAKDVFVQPKWQGRQLVADVEVGNPVPGTTVSAEAVNPGSGKTELSIPAVPVVNGKARLTAAFPNARIWWPDDPQMTQLRVTVKSPAGEDVSITPFGFREWAVQGKDFLLNGIVWRGWAELNQGDNREEWLANYRKTNQRFQRMSGAAQNGGFLWNGMPISEGLNWADQNGVVLRRSGILDGEAIGYFAIETDPELQKLYGSETKVQLLNNWKDQMVAQVKAERNHPSIQLWSIENEFLYINCINLYGGMMDEFERRVKEVGDAVAAVDPTRAWMTDGGGAGKANLFPVAGDHYVYTNDPGAYPDLAYQDQETGAGRGRWTWDKKRPRYAGEDYFASGINPADYAWIGGEEAFGGKTAAHKAMAKVQRMITEGYRWNGSFSAFHLWLGTEGAEYEKYVSNAPRAAFVREYDSTFASTQSVPRTIGVFNDSRFAEPLEFRYQLKFPKFTSPVFKKTLTVPPGDRRFFPVTLVMPEVSERTAGEWQISLVANGKEIFRDVKPISVLPEIRPLTGVSGVAVYDPSKSNLVATLTHLGAKPLSITSLDAIPANTKVLVVGENSISAAQAGDPRLSAIALSGVKVVVLAQDNPLKYQAIPADVTPDTNQGKIAFWEDTRHPVATGLADSDLFGGLGTGLVYENAYRKGIRGFKSLVQAGPRLTLSPLAEVNVGSGDLLLCQIPVQAQANTSAVARHLLANLIRYASSYKLTFRPVTAFLTPNSPLAKAVDSIGLQYKPGQNLLASLTSGIVIVEATPSNLKLLAENKPKLDAFFGTGGTLVVSNLTPEGLADYNRIVGVNHQIRPFRREKTALSLPRHPLASGLSLGDITILSSERMFNFNDDMYVANDVFSYVVDTNDVAPFAQLPSDYHYNITNGFVSADGWPYIFSMELGKGQTPEFDMKWNQPQTLTGMEWIGNAFYHLITKFELSGDDGKSYRFDVKPGNEAQNISFPSPITASKLHFRAVDWTKDPNVGNVIGIDNIRLFPARDTAWDRVQPIANVGGLVNYRIGKGGVVLANLAFKDNESVPANATKKKAILSAVLRNLQAPFAQSKTIIAGAATNEYLSIDISKQANQFRNEKGWFGDPAWSFKDFPAGRQTFAGVPFTVYEFPTSPVPNSVMLGGSGIPGNLPEAVTGIPVGQKVSALFFLQAARIDRRRNADEIRDGKIFEMAKYVIHYADGQVLQVPIRSELDVEDYRQKSPQGLPGALLAWTKPMGDSNLAAYSMPWTNPRPTVSITSVDLVYGKDRVGIPSLLAITAVR